MNGSEIKLSSNPPESDEIEISQFGPGVGECVVVHLGLGDWMVVDSCRDPDSREPAALKYLAEIGVDPSEHVRCIVATHWDDDHIQGLADIVRAAPNAALAISGAFSSTEFNSLVGEWIAQELYLLDSGVDQLREILKLRKGKSPILASENTVVYERRTASRCEVRALSPSHDGVIATITRLSNICDHRTARRLPRIEKNHASVVLSIEISGRLILLGGDLEVRADRDYGWLRVVDCHAKAEMPKHEVFKIPHHGSENGDHDKIWSDLLEFDATAVVSPFASGRTMLPGEKERERIRTRTQNGYLTAPPKPKRMKHPNRMVEKTMQEVTGQLDQLPSRYGHVRVRSRISNQPGDWTIELFGAAEAV